MMVVSIFLFAYLLGAFYSVSLNIAEWEDATRKVVAVVSGTAGLIIGVVILIER